ncbi:MAG TPA: hypothetical protein VMF13_18735 [Luteitalea sp.]|nr:hypothetical protein [Luteitalea sp.]
MPFVAILGAGPLGGALTYALASRGRFDEIRLIDPEKTLAAGKALDILQSGPVDGYSTRVTGSASLDAAAGAWVVLLADPITPDPLKHIAELHRRSPGAILVTADTAHHLVMARAVATGAIPPDRLVGSAPTAAASAARALLALDCDTSPADIHVAIAARAEATGRCALDWATTTIEGDAAEARLRREERAREDARFAGLWPPGPLTLAAAAARVAEAAWFGSRRAWPAWWVTDGGAAPPVVQRLRFAPGGRVRAAGDTASIRAGSGR